MTDRVSDAMSDRFPDDWPETMPIDPPPDPDPPVEDSDEHEVEPEPSMWIVERGEGRNKSYYAPGGKEAAHALAEQVGGRARLLTGQAALDMDELRMAAAEARHEAEMYSADPWWDE